MNLFTIYLFTSYHFMNKIAMPQYVAYLAKAPNTILVINLVFMYRLKWSKILCKK